MFHERRTKCASLMTIFTTILSRKQLPLGISLFTVFEFRNNFNWYDNITEVFVEPFHCHAALQCIADRIFTIRGTLRIYHCFVDEAASSAASAAA